MIRTMASKAANSALPRLRPLAYFLFLFIFPRYDFKNFKDVHIETKSLSDFQYTHFYVHAC